MNALLLLVGLLLYGLPLLAQPAHAIEGNWQDADNHEKQIRIYARSDAAFYGEVINDTGKNPKMGHGQLYLPGHPDKP